MACLERQSPRSRIQGPYPSKEAVWEGPGELEPPSLGRSLTIPHSLQLS
jgi:hypothetical protein